MMKASLSFVVLVTLGACSGPADDVVNQDEGADEVRVREGGRCGGGTLHAPVCARGLTCVFAHTPPRPGERGVCHRPPACVQTQLCVRTAHWDHDLCRCVPDATADAGAPCVQTQLCVRGSHWDRDACRCVPDAPADAGHVCVQTQLCTVTSHWDHDLCRCVPTEGSCAAAADCTGPLPQFCQVCADGHTACARWSCVDHACAIATCI